MTFKILMMLRIPFASYSRIRTIFILILFLLMMITYILWPWLYAAWVWRSNSLEVHVRPDIADGSSARIPRIIHQTWRDAETVPFSWQQASNSCRTIHPNYEYRLWTDKEGRDLIEREFPCLLPTFDSYPYDIQRADVIRLVTLYVYGGIYLDLDIICLQSLDELLHYNMILPRTRPVGLSNDFIMAEAKHPFLLQVIGNLPKYQRRILTKYSTVMFTTGPMFLTYQAAQYKNRSSIHVLSAELYGKYTFNASRSMFRHLKASSWHGNDAMLIRWFYRHRNTFFNLLILVILLTFVLINIFHYHHISNFLKNYSAIDANSLKK